MNRLDTISIQAPFECVTDVNYIDERVELVERSKKNKSFSTNLEYSIIGSPSHGIKNTSIRVGKDIRMNFSAKVLLDNYLDGINLNNIEEAVHNINKVSPFKVNSNLFIENAFVNACDGTQMVYPRYDLSSCVDAMMILRTNQKLSVERYNKRSNLGVVLDSSTKKKKRRVILYSKHHELARVNKRNLAFFKNCNDPQRIINLSKGSLRIEQNHKNRSTIRSRFKSPNHSLLGVLNSKENPNYNYLNKVFKNIKNISLFKENDYRLQSEYRRIAMTALSEEMNRDLELIRVWLSYRVDKSNISRELSKYKILINELTENDFREKGNTHTCRDIVDHIIHLVKVAA